MMAAAREIAAIELKLGSCASTSCTAAKMAIQARMLFCKWQSWQVIAYACSRDFPAVTMYTMSTPTSTTSCNGITIHSPNFSPNASCPSSWYRSNRLPGTASCISTICQSVKRVTTHETKSANTPGPLERKNAHKINPQPQVPRDICILISPCDIYNQSLAHPRPEGLSELVPTIFIRTHRGTIASILLPYSDHELTWCVVTDNRFTTFAAHHPLSSKWLVRV